MKILLCVALAGFLLYGKSAHGADGFECRVSPKFSSGDGLAQTVTESLRQAKQRVTLALYGFNNAELADELVKMAKKGIAIKVKVDSAKGAEKKTVRIIDTLKGAGVQVQTVAPGGRNHNKFAVIDGTRVLTGCYNWTAKAESNWENLLVLDCADLAKAYESEWEKIR